MSPDTTMALVEDEPDNILLVRRALQSHPKCPVLNVFRDGIELFTLHAQPLSAIPNLIVLSGCACVAAKFCKPCNTNLICPR